PDHPPAALPPFPTRRSSDLWGELQPYKTASFLRFAQKMRENWAYLLEQDIAPVWVGEFGAPDVPSDGDLNYWKNLIKFMRDEGVDRKSTRLNSSHVEISYAD